MELPEFIRAFPAIDLPIPDSKLSTNVMRTDQGLAVFFTAHEDLEIPPHSHKAQWGTVLNGAVELTIGGETRTYRPGDTYSIAEGVEHGAKITKGSVVLDIFEEPDRYPIKG